MAINHKLYPDTAGEGSVRADVREEPPRDQPPRDGSSEEGSLKTVSPVTNGGIITAESSDFSVLGHKKRPISAKSCAGCGVTGIGLMAEHRNPGKHYQGPFYCSDCNPRWGKPSDLFGGL